MGPKGFLGVKTLILKIYKFWAKIFNFEPKMRLRVKKNFEAKNKLFRAKNLILIPKIGIKPILTKNGCFKAKILILAPKMNVILLFRLKNNVFFQKGPYLGLKNKVFREKPAPKHQRHATLQLLNIVRKSAGEFRRIQPTHGGIERRHGGHRKILRILVLHHLHVVETFLWRDFCHLVPIG